MRLVGISLFAALAVSVSALGDIPEANPDDFRALYKSMQGATKALTPPTETKTGKGYLRFLGAPQGAVFRVLTTDPAPPEMTAAALLQKHGRAFGAVSSRSSFKAAASRLEAGRGSVCLDQEYSGVPVFGAHVFVQTDKKGGVFSALSDIMRETSLLDNSTVSLSPSITLDRAKGKALDLMRSTYGNAAYDVLEGRLYVFAPPVVGDSGDPCLVWAIVAVSQTDPLAKEVILVDAHSQDVRLHHSLVPQALRREIYDAFNTSNDPGTLVRVEGGPIASVADANLAYDYLGDTYNFYSGYHGRDSIDGNGMLLSATVRYCDPYDWCPMLNAFYDDWVGRMYFGDGMAADDVTAHELTHGVTARTSNLAYYYESGAINESFSDIWGEYVDLTNGKGNDSSGVRWLIGEDTPMNAFRNMADPTQFGDPDIYYGANWYSGSGDYGGVHFNCGVGNKLCYLVTDGDTFNGYSVQGMGIDKAADIFYRVQSVLIPGSGYSFAEKALKAIYIDYPDYGDLLVQAVTDLTVLEPGRFREDDIRSVKSAAYAVEILQFPGEPLKEFRAMSVEGTPALVMTWANPVYPYFEKATLVRNADHAPTSMYDGDTVYSGPENWAIDQPLPLGETYYYALFATFTDTEPPQYKTSVAEVGSAALGVAYETFSGGSDLSYTQILFTPVGQAASGGYTVTVTPGVRELPQTPENAQYGQLLEDDSQGCGFSEPFPFMGEYHDYCWMAENGYLAFTEMPLDRSSYLNFPSGSSANVMPRICVAFADLSNTSAGSIWVKVLPDRMVITYDKLPVYGQYFYSNTAQVELFYSGHIRITCLELTAEEIIVGVTDGQGIFYDPEVLLESGILVPKVLDISSQSDGSGTVMIEPISPVSVNEGMRAEFQIKVKSPKGTPEITLVDAPEGAQLTRVSATQSTFSWLTDYEDTGDYTVVVSAREGSQSATQDVLIHVGNTYRAPTVSQVEVTPQTAGAGSSLGVRWTLYSPEESGENDVYIEWYRNGRLMLPLLNAPTVPGFATNEGDAWYAIVTPYSVFNYYWGVVGESVASNVVTIGAPGESSETPASGQNKLADVNADGVINAVDVQLVVNGVLGASGVPRADVNRDGLMDATDVQVVVNGILRF
ncbi:MAG TPA: M4 family metallopeptidase [Candidatus Hydrogenedentes bacterium]|nr:M4 family metallopeptidase [Candidatus Hydrogenedentota bacterium]